MSRELELLVQECLAGLDAGLTPEECLSAWPTQRDQLEPMLRQAMLLRVAFAREPRAEFRAEAREKLMFAAGREARQAFAVKPDERFVRNARQRLLSAAGASAQESLRNVSPPRLAFWITARRRLLETAATSPGPRPAAIPMTLAFRTASAAAVLVIAVAVAGMALVSRGGSPSVGSELAALEQQVTQVEERQALGENVSPAILVELVRQTAAVAEKIEKSEPQAALTSRAENLIDRQKDVLQSASLAPQAPVEIQQAQQQLDQAEGRLAASRAGTPMVAQVPATQAPSTAVPAASTAVPATSAPASATVRPATPAPLGPSDVRIQLLAGDTTFGLAWVELSTQYLRLAIPSNWSPVGVNFDSTGLGTRGSKFLRVDGPDGIIVNIDPVSGEMLALIGGNSLQLRSESGTSTSVEELVNKAGQYARELSHMLESVVHTPPTPTPTSTPTATSTSTPPPAATPTP